MNYICCCLILCFFYSVELDAQVNPVYKEVQKNRKAITKGRRQVRPDVTIIEPFVDLGYDDSTLARLKNVGADIEKLYLVDDWNVKVRAAISDCIIIGTVTKIEYPYKAPNNAHPFLTIAYINVEEFLRNDFDVPGSNLQVMIHSGPADSETYQTHMGEDTLALGGRFLLFLSARGLLQEAENAHNKNYYQEMINDTTVRFRVFASPAGEFRVRDSVIVNEVSSSNLQEAKDEIRTIVNAVFKTKW